MVELTEGRQMTGQDRCVMDTSNDALNTKVYAESLGYFKDEFVSLFLQRKKKMFPIINRGTWARVYAIRQVILRFIAANKSKVNVLLLGAGYDSTYFWLRQQLGVENTTSKQLDWIEVDFQDVVSKKTKIIRKHAKLSDLIEGFNEQSEHEIITPGYKICACDVREGETLRKKFAEAGVESQLPTMIITECLMIYMCNEDSTAVYRWLREFFKGDLVSLNFEMINPDDQFGRMMVSNLEDRGCELLGIKDCPDINSQIKRMQNILSHKEGEEIDEKAKIKIECLSMCSIYNLKLNLEGEKTRIEKLEMFDEFEEWELMQSHYCLCLGIRMETEEDPHPLKNLCL